MAADFDNAENASNY